MGDPADIIDSTMLGGLQSIRLPRCRHERPEREHWEATRLTSMRALLGEGDVIYDIGSEMGDLSTLYALWGCDVVLCEANPNAFPWARLTFEANGLEPLGSWWGFISDQCTVGDNGGWYDPEMRGTVWPPCADNPLDPATGFVTEGERGPEWDSITIDGLVELTAWVPQAITVDVEGYELRVMRGAERTLRNLRPLVWLSVHHRFMEDLGDAPDHLTQLMERCGYTDRFLSLDHEEHVVWLPEERAGEVWPR